MKKKGLLEKLLSQTNMNDAASTHFTMSNC